jgi:cyanophycinase
MTASPDQPRGRLVAIGGAEDRTSELAILTRVMELAPTGNRTVAVIATASGVPDEVLPIYEAAFERLGASTVHLLALRDRDAATDPAAVEAIQACGVVFFTGGDQLRLTSVLGGSDVLAAIRQRFTEGAVVAGTSAGAAAMSLTMISNGQAADALRKGGVTMSPGLGFVEGLTIDSHFLERGRFTRLMEVGATNPELLGVGLGEDAAVIIHPGRILEALGSGHVIVVDNLGISSSNVADVEAGAPLAVENVVMHALISGHGYDTDQRRYLAADDLATTLGTAS